MPKFKFDNKQSKSTYEPEIIGDNVKKKNNYVQEIISQFAKSIFFRYQNYYFNPF